MKTRRSVYRHSLFWLFYLLYFYSVNLLGNKDMSFTLALFSIPYFALIFYVISGILRYFFRKRKFVTSVSLMILFYSISSCLIYFVMYGNQYTGLLYGAYVVSNYSFSIREFLQTLLIMHGHFTILAILYNEYDRRICEVKDKLEQIKQKISAQQQRDKFEYITLAEQVSAHTMVNVFQYLKMHFVHDSPALTYQINKLYEVMMYYMQSHDANSPQSILCSVELDKVQSYVDIQRSLTSVPIETVWEITGNLNSNTIPPTTLMTLVENAMKHGVTDDPKSPIKVVFSVLRDQIMISVENKIRNNASPISHKVGLNSLKRRLEYVYNDGFQLSVYNWKSWFEVKITIEI